MNLANHVYDLSNNITSLNKALIFLGSIIGVRLWTKKVKVAIRLLLNEEKSVKILDEGKETPLCISNEIMCNYLV